MSCRVVDISHSCLRTLLFCCMLNQQPREIKDSSISSLVFATDLQQIRLHNMLLFVLSPREAFWTMFRVIILITVSPLVLKSIFSSSIINCFRVDSVFNRPKMAAVPSGLYRGRWRSEMMSSFDFSPLASCKLSTELSCHFLAIRKLFEIFNLTGISIMSSNLFSENDPKMSQKHISLQIRMYESSCVSS